VNTRDPFKPSATPEEIHEDLDQAIAKHAEWLQEWHRCVLCGEAPGQKIVSDNAQYLCHFGAWYELHREGKLVDQPAFHALAKSHREMHDVAKTLAVKAWDGGKILAVEHDILTDMVNEFNAKARHLSRAFGKAFSDMDPLTGIHNRQQMLSELEVEWTRFLRAGSRCCIALADLDHFKKINDVHGHHAGDEVLRGSVSRFVSELRPYDTIFRYGGEEFLLCLPNTELDTALMVLDRLRVRLSDQPLEIGESETISVTASFGLAEMDRDATLEELIERADKSLYKAKKEGRNRVCFWDHKARDAAAVA
jgi:diguanylate cyclase